MSATIKYRGSPIATIANGQSVVLECKGIKMEEDLEVSCVGGVDNFDVGYRDGYSKCEADMQDDLQANRDAGYTEGFNEAVQITNDATATAEHIHSGFTAYVAGEKVVGEAKTYEQGWDKANEEFETAVNELNTEFENALYGEARGNDVVTNLEQLYTDLGAIKTKIVEKGVEVADGTPTSEYAGKVDEVYQTAYASGEQTGHASGVEEGYANGYSQCTTDMQDDLEAKYVEGHEAGYNDGKTDGEATGYTNGYNQCTEDMQDDLQAKYDEGYADCETDMQDDLWAKYEEGYGEGASITVAPLIAQSVCPPDAHHSEFFGDEVRYDGQTLDQKGDFLIYSVVDYEYTDPSSPPFAITVNNYHPSLYLHCYIYCVEHIVGTEFCDTLIIAPNATDSVEFEGLGSSASWQFTIYWRFSIDGN